MPIQLNLTDNGHILIIQIDGDWKPEDIAPAKEKTRQIFQQATHTIEALVDLRRASVTLPLLTASQQVIGGDPLPNSGHIAVVGVSRMMRMLAEPLLRMTGSADAVAFFNTLEEAQNHLRNFIG